MPAAPSFPPANSKAQPWKKVWPPVGPVTKLGQAVNTNAKIRLSGLGAGGDGCPHRGYLYQTTSEESKYDLCIRLVFRLIDVY